MPPEIQITSPSSGEVLTYPLAILRGTTSSSNRFIHVTTTSSSPSCIYPVENGSFTALYHLHPGTNTIRLALSTADLDTSYITHTLVYEPPPLSPPFVRLVYLLTKDSDGSFQSPEPSASSNIDSGIARLQTAGLMIQAATAEMMHSQGLQRRTFRLAPSVHVHRLTSMNVETACATKDRDLWSIIANELSTLRHRADTIDVAVMSFSRMRDSKVRAHTALGGGSLALFGGASLFTWPADVDQIAKRLLDKRTFDACKWFDDSAHRMKRMGRRACTATTIGALLHELGHCLSLPHPTGDASKDGGGIMARGFDDFDRLFVGSGDKLPFWDRGSACRLRHHRFLQFEGEAELRQLGALTVGRVGSHEGPVFWKDLDGRVKCRSSVGIGHVGYYKNGDNAMHEEFSEPEPLEFSLPSLSDLQRRCRMGSGDTLVVSAIDVQGRITDKAYSEL